MRRKTEIQTKLAEWRSRQRIAQLATRVQEHSRPRPDLQPVVFFNASARLAGFSQNAAFAFLSSCGLRLSGIPIHHFVCKSGMSHCVLGVNRENYHAPPPCSECLAQSRRLYRGSQIQWFTYHSDPQLAKTLEGMSILQLINLEIGFQIEGLRTAVPFQPGKLALPSLRWILRRHTLPDDEDTRYLLREFILSAESLAHEFASYLQKLEPALVVIFNGIMYPEAAAQWVARQLGVRVVTHEVGFQRFSAFFTEGQATAYPIPIPLEFELNEQQNQLLDEYLENRFQGKFTMAGIRFWPEMRGLEQEFIEKAGRFRQVVPVFTNVIYDTSQVHANQVFSHMFAWLDLILDIIRAHPETYFVIRAHPDEMRPGTAKQSRESVRDWMIEHNVSSLENVRFVDSQEYLSSYELVQKAKFVMVYNSSIGMEAALMGIPVLCGGKARYTQYPMVYFPATPAEYRQSAEDFLSADSIHMPPEFRQNARRFLYYQLFRASLGFENFLEDSRRKGYAQMRSFSWQELLPQNSSAIQVLEKGFLAGAPSGAFLLDDLYGN